MFSGSGSREHHGDGAQDDLDVEPDAPVFDVRDIERDVAVEGWILTALDLPQPSDTGGHIETAQVAELVFAHLAGDGRAGTDDTHFAAQNIKELGQFVKRVFAQEAADLGNARIIADFEEDAIALVHVHEVAALLLGVADHGAELGAAEDVSFFADAFRGVKDGTAGIKLYGNGNGQQQWRKADQD